MLDTSQIKGRQIHYQQILEKGKLHLGTSIWIIPVLQPGSEVAT